MLTSWGCASGASVSTRLGRDGPPGCRGRGTVEDLGGPRRERVSSVSQCGAAHPLPGSAARTADVAGCRAQCLDRRTRTSNGPRRTSPPAAISGRLRASHIDTAYIGVPRMTPMRASCAASSVGCSQSRSNRPSSGSQLDARSRSPAWRRRRSSGRPCETTHDRCSSPSAQVVFDSGIPIWQVPRNSYRQALMSLAELDTRVRPHGPLGRWLAESIDGLVAMAGSAGRQLGRHIASSISRSCC